VQEDEMSPRPRNDRDPLLRLATAARALADAETGVLGDPIPDVSQALAAAPESDVTQVIAFGIFNPYGPTMFSIDLIRVAGTGEALITSTMLNPFQSTATAYAILPASSSGDPEPLRHCLTILSKRNGHPEFPILLASEPTYVLLPRESNLTIDFLRQFVLGLLEAAGIEGIGESAELLEQFAGRPWDRATEEMAIAARSYVQTRMAGSETASAPPVNSPADYDRWWRIASNPEHVRVEMGEMETAWRGALLFGQRG